MRLLRVYIMSNRLLPTPGADYYIVALIPTVVNAALISEIDGRCYYITGGFGDTLISIEA